MPMCRKIRQKMHKAAPHNSARAFGEGFLVETRFEKCRCTLCTRKGHAASVRRQSRQRLRNTSNFSSRWIGRKYPAKAETAIVRCCHKNDPAASSQQGHCFAYLSSTMAMCTSASCFGSTADGASIIRSCAFLFIGNGMTSRMESSPASSMTMRSTPGAIPAWGGAP